ncbi:MAG: 50S ribosomal protein L4 [Deltaproteobacteria bacterium]|nr:50S ribosomal protein L4 [Deltaproteobacteria bacterium]MBW2415181.1 50S ribosomal protein L4 [Deltaproteobacteria bacterium]
MAAKLEKTIFEAPIRADLIQAVVVGQHAARRSGTHAVKNRALVSGGGRKPFKQKGTGRARQGTTRASQHAGGGVTFGPQPRSYAQSVPKKVHRAALRSALSLRNQESALQVVKTFAVSEMKTKLVAAELEKLGVDDVLIVTRERDRVLERAARNLPRVRVLAAAGLNVRDVLARRSLVMTEDAVAAVTERLR